MLIVRNWWPAATWASVIFLFSTDLFSGSNTSSWIHSLLSSLFPSLTDEQIELIHVGVRKLGHWSEYFILALLLMRAVREQFPTRRQRSLLIWSWVLATLYATSDEWHQSFVPSRSASGLDVLIDSLGAICGALWFERCKKNPRSST
jgi:VanZ family protein